MSHRFAHHLFIPLLTATALASCTENNPQACIYNPNLCKAGTQCVQGKDTDGRTWSRCVPMDGGDEMTEAGSTPGLVDAAAGPDASDKRDGDGGTTADGGLAGDGPLSSTDTATSPDAPIQPDASPPDVPGCPNACNLGFHRCGSGGGTQDCVMMNGCPSWGAETACAAPKTCSASTGTCTCPSGCTEGAQRCGTGGGVQTCSAQAGGCAVWGAEVPCQSPSTCKESGTMASCACGSTGCIVGTQQCGPGGGVQSCVQSGVCTTWGPETTCQGGATCHQSGQTAICCANLCTAGAQQCGPGGGIQTCAMSGACTAWGAESACPSPKTCQPSGNNATCVCPATCTIGAQKCGPGGGVQTCAMNGACPAWGSESSCNGYACAGTACKTGCSSPSDCASGYYCPSGGCVPRCASSPPSNLVANPGFDQDKWTLVDKDRGYGNRVPRWDSDDVAGCATSGSMVVPERTAFSNPFPIAAQGTPYYWGYRIKMAVPPDHGWCEVHFCTDMTCMFFLSRGTSPALASNTEWQTVTDFGTIPTPNPATPTPYARIACFGVGTQPGNPPAPDTFFDRVYYSATPVSF